MTAGRALALVALAAAAALGLAALRGFRMRRAAGPAEIAVADLGLELMAGCCAFIVFTSAACRPCKNALRVVEAAARVAASPTEVAAVDAVERSDLAVRYDVRTVPTTFLVTASGRVVDRWRGVPDPGEVRAALGRVA
ncbi:MAG TPA: thioredoxin family protein [Actinomycetota bacterium]|nr:thioredoxin family protein [Actinomycetota bacterium]